MVGFLFVFEQLCWLQGKTERMVKPAAGYTQALERRADYGAWVLLGNSLQGMSSHPCKIIHSTLYVACMRLDVSGNTGNEVAIIRLCVGLFNVWKHCEGGR